MNYNPGAVCRLGLLISALSLLPAQSKQWRGTWSANNTGSGQALGGAWSATLGDDANVAYGSWSVLDRSGKRFASGTWSARKAEKRWEGAWQARDADGRILSGTWSVPSLVVSPSGFAELLDLALSNVVSGSWKARRASGGWSIRAYPQK